MENARQFSPAEAFRITGVSPDVALAWRRRGLWPSIEDGRHIRYSVRSLCALKLMRTLIEAGIPVGTAAEHLTDAFIDPMENAFAAQTRPHLSTGYAVICLKGETIYRFFAFNLSDIAKLGNADAIEWDTTIIINLSSLAKEMVAFGAMD